MTKTALTIMVLVALAGCDATVTTTGSSDPSASGSSGGAQGAHPPDAQQVGETPWWGLPG